MSCGSLHGRGVWGRMDTCVCMAESLCCLSETITRLLIGCTPIQHKKVFKRQQKPSIWYYWVYFLLWIWSLGWEDPVEKAMAPHSSTLAWKIPWMEEPGRLQSMESQRVGHDWATSLSLSPLETFAETKIKIIWILLHFQVSIPRPLWQNKKVKNERNEETTLLLIV